ncbi:esterase/lipase family protein [Persephonella sp.]
MKTITVIIHGWSDCSQSFAKMKEFLISKGIGSVETIYYADYESREDNITYEDVIDGLYDRFKEKGFIDKNGRKLVDLNVIVHSTGGLVIRHFISEYYANRIEDCPVKKVVMLAPANFGSPLAHYGKSLLGMVFKGRYKFGDMFEVGRKLLNGLELASPYQWHLAHRDIFIKEPFYNKDQIQLFVLTGSKGYEGLRKLVNKKGTDGTVVVAGTDLKSVKFRLDFSGEEEKISYVKPPVETAFCVLPKYNHGTIVEKVSPEKDSQIGNLLLKALSVNSAEEFFNVKEEFRQITEKAYRNKEVYQQFFIRAVDDHNKPVKDYTLEFFVYKKRKNPDRLKLSKDEIILSRQVHEYLTDEFHTNSTDRSFRRFIVGIKGLKKLLNECCKKLRSDVTLSVKIHVPKIDEGIYYDTRRLKNVVLLQTENYSIPQEETSLFYPNTTTLLLLKVNRSTKYVTVSLSPKKH